MTSAKRARRPAPPRKSATTLVLIALFKLVKGLLLIAVGVGAVKLLHRDIAQTISDWVISCEWTLTIASFTAF